MPRYEFYTSQEFGGKKIAFEGRNLQEASQRYEAWKAHKRKQKEQHKYGRQQSMRLR